MHANRLVSILISLHHICTYILKKFSLLYYPVHELFNSTSTGIEREIEIMRLIDAVNRATSERGFFVQ